MNYSSHNLRTDLQEWKNRLYRAPSNQFGHQIKYLFNRIEGNIQLAALINDAKLKYPLAQDYLDKNGEQIPNESNIVFESPQHQASFCFQFLCWFFAKYKDYELHNYLMFNCGNFDETKDTIIEDFISPIIYFLHDKLDESNSTIFLLEKYKRRSEWFTCKDLNNRYKTALKSYEQIFEDDLRLFLFDQGIDYPFSTPSSASGRVDIVGEIDTNDPLIIEIKIFDRLKGYGKDRIKDGFTQIVKYANDYNKNVGYLVVFNMDDCELMFNFPDSKKVFPPSINYNNKTIYFIVINCAISESASKIGTLKVVEITEDELIKK